MRAGSDFDWEAIDDAVVIPEQAATAVYENPKGDIVIRQAGRYGLDEHVWIILAPEHAKALADAILRCAAEIRGDVDQSTDEQAPAPSRPMTPAERKRKQREREKDGHGSHESHDANVTARDNVTLFERPFGLPADQDEEELAG